MAKTDKQSSPDTEAAKTADASQQQPEQKDPPAPESPKPVTSGWVDPVPVNVPGAGFFVQLGPEEMKAYGATTSNLRINPGPQMIARGLLSHWYVKANGVTEIK